MSIHLVGLRGDEDEGGGPSEQSKTDFGGEGCEGQAEPWQCSVFGKMLKASTAFAVQICRYIFGSFLKLGQRRPSKTDS